MAITVDIRDQVTPVLRGLPGELSPDKVNKAIGAAEVRLFQNWLRAKPDNKQGWPSVGFWADAARSTNFNLLEGGVLVSINKLGVRQRYEGGEIKPTGGKKYLTIPARAEAYGKRAGEFDNLKLAFTRDSGGVHAWALVEASATSVSFGRKRKDGSRSVTPGADIGGLVMFWLVKSVRQNADPSVLPPDELISSTALEQVGAAVDRAIRRGGQG